MNLETGQETAELLLEFINDVNRPNLGVNFDPANMILYGTGDPIEALSILGPWVRGVHCKDGNWPTAAGQLGEEQRLGEGQVGLPRFIAKLVEVGYEGPLTVEREIAEELQMADWLKAGELLKGIKGELGRRLTARELKVRMERMAPPRSPPERLGGHCSTGDCASSHGPAGGTALGFVFAARLRFAPGGQKNWRDKPGRGGVSACPSGRTVPSIYANVKLARFQWCFTWKHPWCEAPSKWIYPCAKPVKRRSALAGTILIRPRRRRLRRSGEITRPRPQDFRDFRNSGYGRAGSEGERWVSWSVRR